MTQRNKRRGDVPFLFTLEAIRLTEEAITLFEQPLGRADRQNAKVALFEQTITQIKEKLALIKQSSGGVITLTTFDYNEKYLLIQALRAYSFILATLPINAPQIKDVVLCLHIASHFEADNEKEERKLPRF